MDLRKKARTDTKNFPVSPGDHAPEKLKQTFDVSLKALGPHKIRVFYLHAPDRSTPWEVTFKVTDELHKEGKFDKVK